MKETSKSAKQVINLYRLAIFSLYNFKLRSFITSEKSRYNIICSLHNTRTIYAKGTAKYALSFCILNIDILNINLPCNIQNIIIETRDIALPPIKYV